MPTRDRTGASAPPTRTSVPIRRNVRRSCCSSALPRSQPPPGAMATSDRARPRRASSMANHPPSEFPATCTRSSPAASSSASARSTEAEMLGRKPGGTGSPPMCPGNVATSTSCLRSRAGSTGSHASDERAKGWSRRRGSPEPPRCRIDGPWVTLAESVSKASLQLYRITTSLTTQALPGRCSGSCRVGGSWRARARRGTRAQRSWGTLLSRYGPARQVASVTESDQRSCGRPSTGAGTARQKKRSKYMYVPLRRKRRPAPIIA